MKTSSIMLFQICHSWNSFLRMFHNNQNRSFSYWFWCPILIAQFHNPPPIYSKKVWKKVFIPLCNPISNSRPLFENVPKGSFYIDKKKGQKSLRLWFQNDDLNDFNHFSLANGFFPTEMLAWIVYGTLETEQMNVTSRIFISSADQGPLKKWTSQHSKYSEAQKMQIL